MNEFDKLHQHIKECVDSNNELFFVKTDDGLELNIFDWAFGLSCSAKKEVNALAKDRQNAISLMSKSWQHDSEKQDDLMTRYVTMAENQFKKKNEEIERLTAIATKHATRCDELYEALECICSYVSEDGLITTGLAKEIVNAQRLLNKSRTEADK